MLHIVNGDSVGDKLRESDVDGDILVWKEIYSEGPVFLQPALPEHRFVRGSYLEQAMGIPYREWLQSSEWQEGKLAAFPQHAEIILWFEHDLFDQTMLCYLLHWFEGHDLGNTQLYLLSLDRFPGIEPFHGLGQLSAEQLSSLAGTWRKITQDQLQLGKKAWEAYTSSTPMETVSLLQEDTSALPFLHDAFLLHLNRFPSLQNGLGIVEQTTVELIHSGVDRPLSLFQQAGDKLNQLGMGDIQYWLCLKQMTQGNYPLIALEADSQFPGLNDSNEHFLHTRVQLTGHGVQAANNHIDWISLNGIDLWYGGVHLKGYHDIWRSDRNRVTVVRK